MLARYVAPLLAAGAVLCLLVMAVLGLSGVAVAQQMKCAPRDELVKGLFAQFQEVQAARGPLENGTHVMELFISQTGSWTVLATNDKKMSCVVMGGTEGFEFVAPEFPKAGQGT